MDEARGTNGPVIWLLEEPDLLHSSRRQFAVQLMQAVDVCFWPKEDVGGQLD